MEEVKRIVKRSGINMKKIYPNKKIFKIYHSYRDTYHEIEFIKKDIIYEDSDRDEKIEETLKKTSETGSLICNKDWGYSSIPITNSYIICPICEERILINSIDNKF